jgi:uncharacterized protein YrrD
VSGVNPVRSSTPEMDLCFVKFVGGTNAVTKVEGEGVTTTYISAGIVDLTFSALAGAGEFLGVIGNVFQATTTADVKAYALSVGVYNTTTRTLRLNMSESGTLTNLAALEWLNITVAFKRATA